MSAERSKPIGTLGAYVYALKDHLNISRRKVASYQEHVNEALGWLCHAQDGTDDNGFSRSFGLKYGWHSSYPETSGYIIPTLIVQGKRLNRDDLIKRALKATDWLSEVQRPEGGIPAGSVGGEPKQPTIFNTGQVVFGWTAAYLETKEEKYRDSLARACRWLAEAQDEDGVWRRHSSSETKYSVNTYNVRVAWAMLSASSVLDDSTIREAALRKIDWALTQAHDNGWFENNCLGINEMPLTHTIGYTTRSILECGLITDREEYIAAAKKTATSVLGCLRENGYLPGRLTKDWKEGVPYNCLTGACQMSIIWGKLYRLGYGDQFLDGARRALEFVASTQDITSMNSGIRGGIKGCYPINYIYGRYEYLNWAAKFFVDGMTLLSDLTYLGDQQSPEVVG